MVLLLAICSEAAESRRLSIFTEAVELIRFAHLTLCPEEAGKTMASLVRVSSYSATDSHNPSMDATPVLKSLVDTLRRYSRMSSVIWLDTTCAPLDAENVGVETGTAAGADVVTVNAKGNDGSNVAAVCVRVV